jgi:hypothetical protein
MTPSRSPASPARELQLSAYHEIRFIFQERVARTTKFDSFGVFLSYLLVI